MPSWLQEWGTERKAAAGEDLAAERYAARRPARRSALGRRQPPQALLGQALQAAVPERGLLVGAELADQGVVSLLLKGRKNHATDLRTGQ